MASNNLSPEAVMIFLYYHVAWLLDVHLKNKFMLEGDFESPVFEYFRGEVKRIIHGKLMELTV